MPAVIDPTFIGIRQQMVDCWPDQGGSKSVPEFVTVPVDRRVSFHLHVAVNLGLAGQSYFFFGVAEQLQSQQRVDPLVDSLKQSLLAAAVNAVFDNHVTAATGAESHTVQDLVGTGVQLNTVFASNTANVFAFLSFCGDFLVDEGDFRHDGFALRRRKNNGDLQRRPNGNWAGQTHILPRKGKILAFPVFEFQTRLPLPAPENSGCQIGKVSAPLCLPA
ncbi:MAG: hypothetical protein RIK87_16900 [Fuerstiella sp.]